MGGGGTIPPPTAPGFAHAAARPALSIPNDGVTGLPRQISDFRRNCRGKWEIRGDMGDTEPPSTAPLCLGSYPTGSVRSAALARLPLSSSLCTFFLVPLASSTSQSFSFAFFWAGVRSRTSVAAKLAVSPWATPLLHDST